MKKYKSVMELGPRQLWKLRKQVVVNSSYLGDFANDYYINPYEVSDFFDGWLDWLEEEMKEDIKDFKYDDFFKYFEKYDNYHYLNEYRSCFN